MQKSAEVLEYRVLLSGASSNPDEQLILEAPGANSQLPSSTDLKTVQGDFDGDGNEDIAIWKSNGEWQIGISDDSGSYTFSRWTKWKDSGITEVHVGDFNGDERADLLGRDSNGRWRVAESQGNTFTTRTWAKWKATGNWNDIQIGDFNNDGKDDIASRRDDGRWWVAQSNGTQFQTTNWGRWNSTSGWQDVSVGDFNGDGRADITGRTSSGRWWTLLSQGNAFASSYWGKWSSTGSWSDVVVGDFDGDGKDDVAGRRSSGAWWAALSQSNAFATSFLGQWKATGSWNDVVVGDFDGDGKGDIAGRRDSGTWWVGHSQGNAIATSLWGKWSSADNWNDVVVSDYNGDGIDDIIGRDSSGHQWIGQSTGTDFSLRYFSDINSNKGVVTLQEDGTLQIDGSVIVNDIVTIQVIDNLLEVSLGTTSRNVVARFDLSAVSNIIFNGNAGDNRFKNLTNLPSEVHEIVAKFQDVVNAYNSGRLKVHDAIRTIVETGLGQDIPLVQGAIGETLEIVNKLKSVFEVDLDGNSTQEELETVLNALELAGFQLEYIGKEADENGDLLRITYDKTFNTDQVNFNIAGETGFDYFDRDVNGQLRGSLKGQSPTVRVHISFGVDLLNNTPTFYVSDSSYVSFDDLNATGQIDGRMAIRFLAGVQATGSLAVELDGRLSLVDSDDDHKLRITDLSNPSSVIGDVDGSISLNADFIIDLPVLENITWHGSWQADFLDGDLSIGTPTFQLPSVEDVTTAVLTSFVDMKEDFAFLGPIGEIINTELDVIDKTVGELTGAGDKLGWLDSGSGSVSAVKKDLRALGIEVLDINADTVMQLINGEKVDLISYHKAESETLLSEHAEFLFAAAPIGGVVALKVSGILDAELGWQYEVGFGVDTTGVWIDPRTSLGLYGGVSAGIQAELSVAGLVGLSLEAGAGVQIFAGISLRDPDASDGRIYMDEIWRGAEDSRDLGEAILNVIKVDMRLEAEGYVKAELDLPWPLPDITLVDESFNLGAIIEKSNPAVQTESLRLIPLAGQGEQSPPAVMQADGTLLITGTDKRDYVGLKGKDGNVKLKWSGYQNRSYSGVKKVVFNGNGNDDSLTVDSEFNIPIEAYGGEGNDLLFGGTADDILRGGAGNDELFGLDGNDTIYGDAGHDLINGGADDDHIYGGSESDVLRGNAGHDKIDGGDGADAIEGGAGNDILSGGQGFDAIYGGSGNDELDGGDDNDNLSGDEGNDILHGGSGRDAMRGGKGDDQLHGGGDDDLMFGDEGDDAIYGDAGADVIFGGSGNDYVNGGQGSDFIRGESGDDELHGSERDDNVIDEQDVDTIFGGEGRDILRGGRGTDYLNGEQGRDEVNGEAGEDIIIVDLTTSSDGIEDVLAGGVDRDKLWISPANNKADEFVAEAKALMGNLYGKMRDGDTNTEVSLQDADELTKTASTGDNVIRLTQTGLNNFVVEQFDPVSNELVASMAFTMSGGADTDIEIIAIAGMDGNDLIEVNADTTRDLYLDGGDGDDTLRGGSGRDVLNGGAGDDLLVGNANNDELHGGKGNDTLQGNAGTDRLYGDEDNDSLNGGEGFDVLYGGEGDDKLEAGSGSAGDLLYGEKGHDELIGGDGKDVIDGGGGNDILLGGAGNDVLIGGDGEDVIKGQAGHDIILGGAGNDYLYAGDENEEVEPLLTDFLTPYNNLLARELEITHPNNSIDGELEAIVKRLDDEDLPKEQREELVARAFSLRSELTLLNKSQNAILEKTDLDGDGQPDPNTDMDLIDGQEGDDHIWGSRYKDKLIGGDDNDTIHHSEGEDFIIGGKGEKDTYLLDATEEDDNITITAKQNPETSNLYFEIDINGEISIVNPDPDVEVIGVNGLGGNDTMSANLGRNALKDVRFDGGAGNDIISVDQAELTDVYIYDDDGNLVKGQAIESKATLIGGSGNDRLTGGLSDDYLEGGTGIDTLKGGDGRDTLYGGDDRDYLYGGAENDELHGGAENDELHGGEGNDTLYGDAGKDELSGDGGNDTLKGGAGNDWMSGGTENDLLEGENGEDELYGDDGIDTLKGGNNNDILHGGANNDFLYGDNDNDLLYGNSGSDLLDGGGNNDTAEFDRSDRVSKNVEHINGATTVLHVGNSIFALHNSEVWENRGNGSWNQITANGVKTVVAAYGTIYTHRADNAVWEYRGGGLGDWRRITNYDIVTLAVANKGRVYIHATHRAIEQYNGKDTWGYDPNGNGGWTRISGADVHSMEVRWGHIWAHVNTSDGNIDEWNGSTWKRIYTK